MCRDEKLKGSYGSGQAAPAMDAIEEPESATYFYSRAISLWGGVYIAFLLVSAGIFCALSPDLGYFDAIYFSWITATTLGYGDGLLSTIYAREFCCFFILMSTILITAASAAFASEQIHRDWVKRRYMIASQSRGNASMMDAALLMRLRQTARDGTHDRVSFLIAMLSYLDLAPRVDSQLLLQYFDHLDTGGDGVLQIDELLEEHRRVVGQQFPSKGDLEQSGSVGLTPAAPAEEEPGLLSRVSGLLNSGGGAAKSGD